MTQGISYTENTSSYEIQNTTNDTTTAKGVINKLKNKKY